LLFEVHEVVLAEVFDFSIDPMTEDVPVVTTQSYLVLNGERGLMKLTSFLLSCPNVAGFLRGSSTLVTRFFFPVVICGRAPRTILLGEDLLFFLESRILTLTRLCLWPPRYLFSWVVILDWSDVFSSGAAQLQLFPCFAQPQKMRFRCSYKNWSISKKKGLTPIKLASSPLPSPPLPIVFFSLVHFFRVPQ